MNGFVHIHIPCVHAFVYCSTLKPFWSRNKSLFSKKLFPVRYFPTKATNPTGLSLYDAMISRASLLSSTLPLGLISNNCIASPY